MWYRSAKVWSYILILYLILCAKYSKANRSHRTVLNRLMANKDLHKWQWINPCSSYVRMEWRHKTRRKNHVTVTYFLSCRLVQTNILIQSYMDTLSSCFLQKNPLIVWTTLDFRCFYLPSFNSEVIHTEACCLNCCGRMAGGWVIQPLNACAYTVLFLNVTGQISVNTFWLFSQKNTWFALWTKNDMNTFICISTKKKKKNPRLVDFLGYSYFEAVFWHTAEQLLVVI